MKPVNLVEQTVGDANPCYIIAEIGNLFTSFEEAKNLIDAAKNMGADAVKFQTWNAETLTTKNNNFDLDITGFISQYEFLKNLQISEKLQEDVVNYAKEKNITIFSAPSHENDLELMEKLEIPIYKIGSDLACHTPLLKKISKLGKPIILSTGMCTLEEVKTSVNTILNEGNDKLILLHCISDYPSKITESNLNCIQTLKDTFNLPVGYSDHTIGHLTSLTASILGANVIEKHLRHTKNSKYPDDIHSLNEHEFSNLIEQIKNSEITKGDGIKKPSISEIKNLEHNRVSIVTTQKISMGSKIIAKFLDIRRPGYGIQPIHLDNIIGMKALIDIDSDIPIEWKMLQQ
jgi:N,N'-diacetyllegionaminate synthase